MAELTPSYSDSKIRCLKCVIVVMDIFPCIMRSLLRSSGISAKDLHNRINNDTYFIKKLTKAEHLVLNTLLTDGYEKLELTLMFRIIIYFKLIPSPTNGWKSKPEPAEIGVGDDAQRIRLKRNDFMHKVNAELNEEEFENFFSETTSICQRLDSFLNNIHKYTYERKVLAVKEQPLNRAGEVQAVYDEAKSIEEYFIKEEGPYEYKVYKAKSMRDFIQKLKDSHDQDQENMPSITLRFPDLSVADLKQNERQIMEAVNKEGNTKIDKITDGSVLMDISILVDILLDNDLLQKEIILLLTILSKLGVFERYACTKVPIYVVMSAHDALQIIDEYDFEENEDLAFSKESLIIDFKVSKDAIQSEETLQTELENLFGKLSSKSNGNSMFPDSKPIVSIVHPTFKGRENKYSDREDQEEGRFLRDKSNAYTQEFKGDSCSRFSQEIKRPTSVSLASSKDRSTSITEMKRPPSVSLADISTRSTGGYKSKHSSQEDEVEGVKKPLKDLSEEMNPQKAVAIASRAVELEYNTGLTRKILIEEDNDLFYGERSENDIRIVLVGRTGCGKSATGNTILQTKVFKSKTAGSSVTEKCERRTNQVLGKRLVVIDTPGLFATKLAKGEVTREIIRCIQMSAPGPHVFILVLRSDRLTQEETDTFFDLFDIFGEQMSKFAIIAFTHLDDKEHDQSSIEEFISSSDDTLKELIRKVKNRYIAFNNRGSDEQKYRQSEALVKYVDKIVAANGGRCYTNELYKEAEENLRRKIQEVERMKAEEKQREIEEIEKKFIEKIQSVEKINEMQNEMIKSQAKEKMKIELTKKQKEAEIEHLERDMTKLNKKYEKELLEVKMAEKLKAQRELDVLRNRDNEISQLREKIEKQSENTELRLKYLMSEKENEIHKIQSEFQSEMKKTVQDIVAANETVVTSLTLENQRLQEKNVELSKIVPSNEAMMDTVQEKMSNYESNIARMNRIISSLQNIKSESDSSCQIL